MQKSSKLMLFVVLMLALCMEATSLSPNAELMHCCVTKGVQASCQFLCSYDSYKPQVLRGSWQTKCSYNDLTMIERCARRGGDHVECCKEKGVDKICLKFCTPKLTHWMDFSDPQYQPTCTKPKNYEAVIQCYKEYISERKLKI